ncbi:hypothetical protein CAAN1_08S03444 [[Candida] anglica]|uniref:Inheritance of peroxisomes protein 1 n=1 Tax=[Candida] anglica TaxID=148631 RepID=A0ABP0E749_9ASCO
MAVAEAVAEHGDGGATRSDSAARSENGTNGSNFFQRRSTLLDRANSLVRPLRANEPKQDHSTTARRHRKSSKRRKRKKPEPEKGKEQPEQEPEKKKDKELPRINPTSLPYNGKLSTTSIETPKSANTSVSTVTTPAVQQRSPYTGRIRNPSIDGSVTSGPLPVRKSSPMSPRKQSIKRYNDSAAAAAAAAAAVSTNNTNSNSIDPAVTFIQPTYSKSDKHTLFSHPSSKVLVFDEQLKDETRTDLAKTSGRLLGHGTIEIFQLNNGVMTYLACGTSFVYPLLRKLKILRTSFNTFILPLVNPERYWKISVDTSDAQVIARFEEILKETVRYRKLFFVEESSSQEEMVTVAVDVSPSTPIEENNDKMSSLDDILPNTSTPKNEFQLSISLPESPPSAPISPHNPVDSDLVGGGQSHFDLDLDTPSRLSRPAPTWPSDHSFMSALASLDVNDEPMIHHPKPKYPVTIPHSNPFQVQRHSIPQTSRAPMTTTTTVPVTDAPVVATIVSNVSTDSLDSLLDEYEENITTKSAIVPSRPQSRASTSFVSSAINYKRPSQFEGKIEDEDPYLEDFPTTSLSEYNRIHNGVPALTKSRSSYSIATSLRGGNSQNLSTTYREIYRSITERNLAQHLAEDDTRSAKSTKSHYQSRSKHPPLSRSAYTPAFTPVAVKPSHARKPKKYSNSVINERPGGLNPDDVYKMVSSRSANVRKSGERLERERDIKAKQNGGGGGIASRLFGW